MPSEPVTRILGIAPYEGMKHIMESLAAKRDDIQLDVYVGDLQQGVEIVRRNRHENYHVIISRGGTAQLISQVTQIPVVEVGFSGYDILRVLKISENYARKYAIVGFPNIASNARLMCSLLQYDIEIFTIHSSEEVYQVLSDLKEKGYEMVLCDVIANATAKKLGLNALLITSGAESITAAFDEAVKLNRNYYRIQSEKQFYKEILMGGNDSIIVFKENGELFFSSVSEEQNPELFSQLRNDLPSFLDKKTHKFFKNIDGTLYSFTSRYFSFSGEQVAAFYYSSSFVPFAASKYGIQYTNLQEAEDLFFNSFFSLTNPASNIRTTIRNMNQTYVPIMISGETGAGKEQVARSIYSQSRFSSNPLITINCTLLNERSWNFLINHYNSPFTDNDNTLYFKNIDQLTTEKRTQLLSVIIDTNLCKRNHVIFSCNCSMGEKLSPEAMEYVNQLSCVLLHLPPLREHTGEIPALAGLYLNMLNTSMENQVIGLEPEALTLLQEYDWPYNYTQFKRILNELALAADSPYIQAESVRMLLREEKKPSQKREPLRTEEEKEGQYLLDLNRPLNDINREIIEIVLNEMNGNQSAAARRLGIGRSTLWRYLK